MMLPLVNFTNILRTAFFSIIISTKNSTTNGERRQFRMRFFRNKYFESLRVPQAGLGQWMVRLVRSGQVRLEFQNPRIRNTRIQNCRPVPHKLQVQKSCHNILLRKSCLYKMLVGEKGTLKQGSPKNVLLKQNFSQFSTWHVSS